MSRELINAMVAMKEKEAVALAEDLIKKGEDPLKIFGACREAMEIVGKNFEKGEFFLPELIMAGEMLKQISDLIKPLMKEDAVIEKAGKVIIGTVKGDIHDMGKNIVVMMLDVSGFEVLDLGIDVPVEKFIKAIKDFQPAVVGLSGFLTMAFDSMKETIDAISAAGLRDNIKIMLGGGQIDEEIRKYTGADDFGDDAVAAVNLAQKWIGRN
ncbi:MAG: cobalamin-dependent protein [Desulfobacterales bacterium]|nr:cobalamin-dependent protein [Desulfobacterales bacterium]